VSEPTRPQIPRHRARPRWLHQAAIGSVLVALSASTAAAYPRPGLTTLVSAAADGASGNGLSSQPSISADGRYVAFSSLSSNLVAGDTNDVEDVFVRDRSTGTTELVSVAGDGTPAGPSVEPAISADGRVVAFVREDSGFIPGSNIFVRDSSTFTTELVSMGTDGTPAGGSGQPSISADGRYVAFFSLSPNLVQDDTNNANDVFVRDRATGTTERISVASDGAQGAGVFGNSAQPSISTDGRYVAFVSWATTLVVGDANAWPDVFVRDRATGTTELVSMASDGTQGNSSSGDGSLSADGRYIAFGSYASNLVPGDTNGQWDVFVRDRTIGTTERVSVDSHGAEGRTDLSDPVLTANLAPSISADGRYIAFRNLASNLVPGDTNGQWDVFVRDRTIGTTERVSVASDGTEGSPSVDSFEGSPLSADGRYVAFGSEASNLVPGDTNDARDVFVRDRGGALGVPGMLSVAETPGGLTVSGRAAFSGTVLTEAPDPDSDGAAPGLLSGAELTGAALVHRPEQEDLLVRLRLASLPPVAAGVPGVVYGLELQAGGIRFEVRALRAAATSSPPGVSHIALYRCATSCIQDQALEGAFGSTGEEVVVSLPLGALGVVEETEISGLRAFTALGEASPGGQVPADEIVLGAAVVPTPRVELGIAPAATPDGDVAYTVVVLPAEGAFSGTMPTSSLSPGEHRVWARACMGEVCGPATHTGVLL